MSEKWKDRLTDQLCKAILSLESEEEAYRFLEDVATIGEIIAFAQRLEVARLLYEGNNYPLTLSPLRREASAPQQPSGIILANLLRSGLFKSVPVSSEQLDAASRPGLWLSTAMGARGLTLALLCGELLAARLHGEPLPLDARLARALSTQRLRRA